MSVQSLLILNGYENFPFQSSAGKTPQFLTFAKRVKNALKKNIPSNYKIADYNIGHFYVSGFIEHEGRYIYFSTSDVRTRNPLKVYYRTATDKRDFTGGINNDSDLIYFIQNITDIFKQLY